VSCVVFFLLLVCLKTRRNSGLIASNVLVTVNDNLKVNGNDSCGLIYVTVWTFSLYGK
jgi:hypothetical protein